MKAVLIGASLYSVIVAIKLRSLFPQLCIEIIDGGSEILNTWKPKVAGRYYINNGFHGIELPRASGLCSFLEDVVRYDRFRKILNVKKLYINGSLCNYTERSEAWPKSLIKQFPKIEDVKRLGWPIAIKRSEFYQSIQKCSIRYGDDADDFLGRFYPWFFPAEHLFPSGDEGFDFQNKVRSGCVSEPSYVLPLSGLFHDMIKPLHEYLLTANISVKLNYQVSLDELQKIQADSEGKIFWTCSMANLYSNLLGEKQLPVKNKRHLHNLVFEIPSPSFNFSEILIMDDDIPYASRVSFVKSIGRDRVAVQLEYISEFSTVNEAEIEALNAMICNIFNSESEYAGMCYGRPIFGLTTATIEEANSCIKSHFENAALKFDDIVLRPYWYPINTNKCFEFACDDLSSYQRIISRS